MKRALNLLLVIILIFSAGCSKKKEAPKKAEKPKKAEEVIVSDSLEGYMLRPDTLNPLLTKHDINRRMLSLCFDSLFYIDSDFQLKPCLAESYTLSDSCDSLTVYLRQDALWHDGTTFKASDVTYTMNNILDNPGSYYNSVLAGIISEVSVIDASTVRFELSAPNSGVANLLTFPILKSSQKDMSETLTDYIPVGTGAFKLKSDEVETVLQLEKNPEWVCGTTEIKNVNLTILPDTEAVFSAFNTGVIDFVEITRDNAGKFSVNENVSYSSVYTENYTYAGLNFTDPLLEKPVVRQLLSAALDRNALTDSAFSGYALPTELPMHPKAYFYSARGGENVFETLLESSPEITVEDGKLYYNNPETENKTLLNFTILVNQENTGRCLAADYIANSLIEHGIDTVVEKTDFETYKTRIESGDFEIYLGSSKLSADLNLSPLISAGGSLNYGKYAREETETALANIYAASDSAARGERIREFQAEFHANTPHIPLYFENEMIVYNSKKLSNPSTVLTDNIYSFITGCTIKEK